MAQSILSSSQQTRVRINPVYYNNLDNDARYEIIYGGAGSGKSHFIAQKKVIQHLRDSGRRTLVIRKVGNTLRNSCFGLIKQTIYDMGAEGVFNVPRGMTNLNITGPNGNEFIFTGLDDPEKLKSIVGVTDIWIEEASEISEDDFKQVDLRLRGDSPHTKQITLTYNPISALSWLKSFFHDYSRDNCTILKTTYKDNYFIDDEYIKMLEDMQNRDYVYYQIYALGEWGVLGNLVFSNYIVEDIPTDPNMYKAIYQGLDFGFNDPSAFVKVGLKDDELYILAELYQSGLTNNELITALSDKADKDFKITADSSEPSRIKEFNQHGWRVKSAEKGAGSIKAGLDWAKRKKIHIHPNCTNFIKEIQGYKYKEDKNGNVFDEPIDMNNHLMDALRYAIEPLSKQTKWGW